MTRRRHRKGIEGTFQLSTLHMEILRAHLGDGSLQARHPRNVHFNEDDFQVGCAKVALADWGYLRPSIWYHISNLTSKAHDALGLHEGLG